MPDSPMLKRIHHGRKKATFTIPKKGRIRLFLLFIALVIGLWFLFRPQTDATVSEQKRAAQQPVSQQREAKEAEKQAKKRVETLDKQFLKHPPELIRRYPPAVTVAADTLHFKKESIIRSFTTDTALSAQAKNLLRRYKVRYGAVAAIDPFTGKILALGSYTGSEVEPLATDMYCRSFFPAASLFKAVTASAAIENGLEPQSMLKQVGRNHTLYRFQLEKELKNYREISLLDAFAYSINPVFGRLGLYTVGREALIAQAGKFGFYDSFVCELATDPPQFDIADSAIHVAEVASGFHQGSRISPLFAARMMGAFVAGGTLYQPYIVDSMRFGADSTAWYRAQPKPLGAAIPDSVAEEMRTLFKAVPRYGTARKSFRYVKKTRLFSSYEYGGKTGSVDRDGMGKTDWFMGYSVSEENSHEKPAIAIAVVTVHGPYWTVHSAFIAAELMRSYITRKDSQ